jgi:molybdopterin-guanine dinucleotide biosynthesis protein A
MSDVEGFILVGGASSRMGCDKARLKINGEEFVEKIASVLSNVTERVSTVGSRYENDIWHLPNVPDRFQKWGALGGLHASLYACKANWALVVACDLPFVTEELFRRLISMREGYESVVPIQTNGKLQPLCALYRVESCLKIAEEMISHGTRRPRDLFERVKTKYLGKEDWQDLPNSDLFFNNINTPFDYEKLKDNGIKLGNISHS